METWLRCRSVANHLCWHGGKQTLIPILYPLIVSYRATSKGYCSDEYIRQRICIPLYTRVPSRTRQTDQTCAASVKKKGGLAFGRVESIRYSKQWMNDKRMKKKEDKTVHGEWRIIEKEVNDDDHHHASFEQYFIEKRWVFRLWAALSCG